MGAAPSCCDALCSPDGGLRSEGSVGSLLQASPGAAAAAGGGGLLDGGAPPAPGELASHSRRHLLQKGGFQALEESCEAVSSTGEASRRTTAEDHHRPAAPEGREASPSSGWYDVASFEGLAERLHGGLLSAPDAADSGLGAAPSATGAGALATVSVECRRASFPAVPVAARVGACVRPATDPDEIGAEMTPPTAARWLGLAETCGGAGPAREGPQPGSRGTLREAAKPSLRQRRVTLPDEAPAGEQRSGPPLGLPPPPLRCSAGDGAEMRSEPAGTSLANALAARRARVPEMPLSPVEDNSPYPSTSSGGASGASTSAASPSPLRESASFPPDAFAHVAAGAGLGEPAAGGVADGGGLYAAGGAGAGSDSGLLAAGARSPAARVAGVWVEPRSGSRWATSPPPPDPAAVRPLRFTCDGVSDRGAEAQQGRARLSAPAAAVALAPPLRVLVVDDVATNVRLLKSGLVRDRSVAAETASDGDEMVELMVGRRERFDVVLLDEHMSRMNGSAAAEIVRRRAPAPPHRSFLPRLRAPRSAAAARRPRRF